MKIVSNKRWKFDTGYQYLQLASDGKRWRLANGLVQPNYGHNRSTHYYYNVEEATKQYNFWLNHYTKKP